MTTPDDVQFSYNIDPMAVAAFFVRADHLRDEPDVTPMKLQKLMYFAQANYLASTGQRLFNAPVEAFDHGPVVYDVWNEFTGNQIIDPAAHERVMHTPVPDDVERYLERIWVQYQDFSASALRNITHRQAPWKDHYEPGAYRARIPDDAMHSYFSQKVAARDRVFHDQVVVVPADALDDDEQQFEALAAFLNA